MEAAFKDLESQLNDFLTLQRDHDDEDQEQHQHENDPTKGQQHPSKNTDIQPGGAETIMKEVVSNVDPDQNSSVEDKPQVGVEAESINGGGDHVGAASVMSLERIGPVKTMMMNVQSQPVGIQLRATDDASFLGYLEKYRSTDKEKSSPSLSSSSWTKRFFALIEDRLFMYNNHDASKPLVSFPLTTSTIVQVCEDGNVVSAMRPWVFEVRDMERVWILAADEEDDMIDWIDYLHRAIDMVPSNSSNRVESADRCTSTPTTLTQNDMIRSQLTPQAYQLQEPSPTFPGTHLLISSTPTNSPHPSLPSSLCTTAASEIADETTLPPMYTPAFYMTSLPPDQKELPPPIPPVSLSFSADKLNMPLFEKDKGLFSMYNPDAYPEDTKKQVYMETKNGITTVRSNSSSNTITPSLASSSTLSSSSSSSSSSSKPSRSNTTATTSSNPFKSLFTKKSTTSSSSSGPSSSPTLFRKRSTQYFEVGDIVTTGDYAKTFNGPMNLNEWAKLHEKKLKDEAKLMKVEGMVKAIDSVVNDERVDKKYVPTAGIKQTKLAKECISVDMDMFC
ncbi:hypothetical protein HDU76_008676 [Blyttiomyces sp. JEL0837]|nr:hypothetical protein HDU76_008676 [Blyttiomyces sp. JEL0837]